MKINLGCGSDYREGFVNVDKQGKCDVVWDLEKTPLPFEDNSVEYVLAKHILEHITNLLPLLNDLHRICKNGAIIHIEVPLYDNPNFWDNPTHVRPFTEWTFDFICNKEDNIDVKSFRLRNKSVFGSVNRVLVVDLEVVK
jgi:predicted SAM-dependent methyltransferase